MRGAIIIFTLLLALIVEWSSNAVLAATNFFLPVAALVFCFWSWQMSMEARLWLGLGVGLVMDAISLIPFGSSMLAFLILALACEFLRMFFSDTESKITRGVSVALLMAVFLGSVPLWSMLLAR